MNVVVDMLFDNSTLVDDRALFRDGILEKYENIFFEKCIGREMDLPEYHETGEPAFRRKYYPRACCYAFR